METEVGTGEPEPFILPQAMGAVRSYLAYLEEHDPNHKHVLILRRIVERFNKIYGENTS